MFKGTIKSKKWYGRFWLPERKKIKIMQAIYDYYEPEIWQKYKEKLVKGEINEDI